MKISQLKGKIQEIDIPVPGAEGEETEVVKVKYRPGALDLAALERFDDRNSDLSSIRSLLEPLLVEWDIQNDDGTPLGVTGKDLGSIPLDFLTQVMEAITESARPNPQMGETSEDGSPQTDVTEVPQNGTDSSKQQDTFV